MELLKLLTTSEIFAQIISFLVLFFLLKKFAWKSLLEMLDKRKEKIASEFARIESGRGEVDRLKVEYMEKLSSAENMARAKVQEAVNEARRDAEEIRKSAKEEAKNIFETERLNIQREMVKSKEELKNDVVDIVMEAVEKVVGEKIARDGQDGKKVVREFLEKMDKMP